MDTGASVSIVKDSLVKGQQHFLETVRNQIADIKDNELPVLGKTTLSVDWGTKEAELECTVLKKEMPLVTEGIVREDFLVADGAIVSYKDQTLQLGFVIFSLMRWLEGKD